MMKKLLSNLKSIAISLTIFLVLLAVTNWLCGVYVSKLGGEKRDQLPAYADDPAYAQAIFKDYHSVAHRYRSFVGWQTQPYEGKTLHINQAGLRTHTPATISDKPIIRFFGGSTMWGEGADDAHTIPALVNQKMDSGVVYNHAQLAYNSRQSLDALISLYAQGEKSDVVIFYDGVNDAAFLCPQEIQELPSHRLAPFFQKKIYGGKKQLLLSTLNNVFTENILLLIRYYKNTGGNKPSLYDCVGTQKGETIARMLLENWEMAHDLVTSRGGRFIAILQPASFIGSARVDYLELNEELGESFKAVYGEIQKLIAEKNHSWIYDETKAFDGNEYIYIDFCHVTKNGNQRIANSINQILSDSIR